jgi:subtilisin family serine protease
VDCLDLIQLTPLMERSKGRPEVKIGLIDGTVDTQHPDLAGNECFEALGNRGDSRDNTSRVSCEHATFIAGILSARRGSIARAICPDCTLLVRPIFTESTQGREHMPTATPRELAAAIIECVDASARVINLSLALAYPSVSGKRELEESLCLALGCGVIVVAATGNQGSLGSSAITRHPWVIPIVACELAGRPMNESNLSGSTGRRGLSAPGEGVTSLGAKGKPLALRTLSEEKVVKSEAR